MNQTGTNRIAPSNGVLVEGRLIVAAPGWHDDRLGRTVCYVVHHGPQGSVGVVLNRCVGPSVAKAIDWLIDGRSDSRRLNQLYVGGPSAGPLVAIHDNVSHAEFQVGDGLCFTASLGKLRDLLAESSEGANLKLVIGQVGWKAGQLDTQLRQGNWYVLPADPRIVFAEHDQMWRRAMRQVGDYYLAMITGCRGVPRRPDYN
ncbi:MAG: YqgE/AlgH family protein [Planctomycetota bacterium]|nr:MAG: YqgE/AlgH family protein [Planctomycetota bacterium]